MDDEGRVIVADCRNHRVQVLSQDGEPLFKFGDTGPEKLQRPLNVFTMRTSSLFLTMIIIP